MTAKDYKWQPFKADCPECGGDVEVFTDSGKPNLAQDGNAARCKNCGQRGSVVIVEEDESAANHIHWEDGDE